MNEFNKFTKVKIKKIICILITMNKLENGIEKIIFETR